MRIGGLISYLSNRNGAIINVKLKPYGITRKEAEVINCLYKNGCISQEQLIKNMLVNKSLVTRILKHMEKKGLIERTVSLKDKRSYDLNLTDKGKELSFVVDEIFEDTSGNMMQGLNDEEKEILLDLLNKVKKNMEG